MSHNAIFVLFAEDVHVKGLLREHYGHKIVDTSDECIMITFRDRSIFYNYQNNNNKKNENYWKFKIEKKL